MIEPSFAVKIGINPIGWSNDDLPSLGAETALPTMLSEGRQIGYQGFELGNKFPRDPQVLRELMAGYGLEVVSGWYSGRLAQRSVKDEIVAAESHLRLLVENGCEVMVYGEVADAIQGERDTPLDKRPQFHDEASFRRYGERLTEFARYLLSHGVRLAYHHHMGAYIESPSDIDRLMAATGDEMGLLYDSGHALFGGGDPLDLLRRHIGRVCHVHVKDVRPEVARIARNRRWSFLDAVLSGVFTVPGDGVIDFAPLIGVLRTHGYRGWLVVEAEQDPALAPGQVYAEKGYRTLRSVLDGVSGQVIA